MATINSINTPLLIPVSRGGTGASTLTSHGILLGNGTGTVSVTNELSDGQLLIGSTGNSPVLSAITAGAGISVTNAPGSITIAATADSPSWTVITADQTIAASEEYITNGSGTITLTLPADGSSTVGDSYSITTGTQQWVLAQLAGESVRVSSGVTTTGTGGSLASTALGDSIRFVKVASNSWQVVSVIGNITIV